MISTTRCAELDKERGEREEFKKRTRSKCVGADFRVETGRWSGAMQMFMGLTNSEFFTD